MEEVLGRMAAALEFIATKMNDPSSDLIARVAALESLLREFVSVMEDSQTTDQDWVELLADVKEALEGVEV